MCLSGSFKGYDQLDQVLERLEDPQDDLNNLNKDLNGIIQHISIGRSSIETEDIAEAIADFFTHDFQNDF